VILVVGAFLGFFSVFFGAYSEHSLRGIVSEEHFRQLMTGIRYNQVNSVLISAIGIANLSKIQVFESRFFQVVGYLFILGTTLFSFSIYASISFNLPKLVYLTPFGGVTIMLSWVSLLVFGILTVKNNLK
jgi:uncharacterized membrane protein YgdD (TMEM256/DUF423 family)|tara:strand:- start:699 stop:1088 length:390 start_codon:yes stop_codon:yes gene_type:complete